MTTACHPLAVAILAGGSSARMGTDKARLEVGGRPLIQRVAQSLSVVANGETITVIGGSAELAGLTGVAATHVPDAHPGEGPLGGILTALQAQPADVQRVLVAACDLPELDPAMIRHLAAESEVTNADLCVPLQRGRRQWHLAIWHRRCLGPLVDSFAGGNRSVWRATSGLRQTLTVTAAATRLVDLDTPDDVADFGEK